MSPSAHKTEFGSDAVAIIGGGIIGLSLAYELAVVRGARVTIYDTRAPGRGASWAAAGMIAPAFEAAAEPGVHPRLFDLCMESAELWPEFAERLSVDSGLSVGFDREASLAVALDAAQQARLESITLILAARHVRHEMLTTGALLQREPALSGDVLCGMELPTDFRVHNRAVVTALLSVLRSHLRVRFVDGPAPLVAHGAHVGLEGHSAIVAAAGWETPVIKVAENGQHLSLVNWDVGLDDIDCHGGQMLSVKAGLGAPSRVVRAGHVYLVPRDGEVVIGATTEPGRVLEAPEADVIEGLRLEGLRLCPGLADAAVIESWAGVRPGTPDHAPLLGQTITPGLFVAAGHYRNGILLAPITARILADAIEGKPRGEFAAAFTTQRVYAATA